MKFLTDNYLILILIGLFFVFALIGYIIDSFRKPKKEEEEIPEDIKKIQEMIKNKQTINPEVEKKEEKPQDVLNDYDKEVK